MDQDRINRNLTNSLIIVNKALINILERQAYMFNMLHDQKYSDLTLLDLQTLEGLRDHLDKMRAAL